MNDLLLEFMFRDVLALLTVEMVELVPGTCMEHIVATLAKDKTQLLVVIGHQGRTWLLL